MLTQQELCKTPIDLEAAKQALAAADRRLADLIDGSKTLDAKAQALFTAYNTVALAAIGAGGALLNTKATVAWALFVAAGVLILGSVCCIAALLPRRHGVLGTDPRVWLEKGAIDVSPQFVANVLALMTSAHTKRIQDIFDANDAKSTWVIGAVMAGGFAPLFALLVLLVANG